jgi:hypothetical protein
VGERSPNVAECLKGEQPVTVGVPKQIVKVVDTLQGSRPFRVRVDPADDGAEDVFRVGDRVRQWRQLVFPIQSGAPLTVL